MTITRPLITDSPIINNKPSGTEGLTDLTKQEQSARFRYHGMGDQLLGRDHEIVCISSGHEEETAAARYDGSLFTRLLYKYLDSLTIDELMKKMVEVGYQKTPIATASHPHLKRLWRWFRSRDIFEVDYDPLDNLLIIK